jgi:predicted RNA-binding protein with PUA-like domain
MHKDTNTWWSGVRNYQARNYMKQMSVGDLCLFYHSNGTQSAPTGVYGVVQVSKAAQADTTAQNPNDEHFDPKSTVQNPIWECVEVSYLTHLKQPVFLADIKLDPRLTGIIVASKGSRLSVQPVSRTHFEYIVGELGETIL